MVTCKHGDGGVGDVKDLFPQRRHVDEKLARLLNKSRQIGRFTPKRSHERTNAGAPNDVNWNANFLKIKKKNENCFKNQLI